VGLYLLKEAAYIGITLNQQNVTDHPSLKSAKSAKENLTKEISNEIRAVKKKTNG
jgi:hypothetical protein